MKKILALGFVIFSFGFLLKVGLTYLRMPAPLDIEVFKSMARAAECADIANDLYVIDGKMVLWDRQGNCADAAYSFVLYGKTPEEVLCAAHDSIAGPQTECKSRVAEEFFKKIDTGDDAGLGLGPRHKILKIDLLSGKERQTIGL